LLVARPRLAVLLLTPVALLLAGCSANAASGGKPTATESSPATTSATPSTTPTPTAAVSTAPARSKETYGVLTLELQRTGKTIPAMEPAITTFIKLHEDFATMAAGQAQPADMTSIASGPVINFLSSQLTDQRKRKEHSAGTLAIRGIQLAGTNISRSESGTTTSAVIAGCFDQRKLVTIRPDRTKYVDSTVRQYPTLRISATVTGSKVTAYELKAGTC
jgi:hypothetical protein